MQGRTRIARSMREAVSGLKIVFGEKGRWHVVHMNIAYLRSMGLSRASQDTPQCQPHNALSGG
jgi:hypothetical protein